MLSSFQTSADSNDQGQSDLKCRPARKAGGKMKIIGTNENEMSSSRQSCTHPLQTSMPVVLQLEFFCHLVVYSSTNELFRTSPGKSMYTLIATLRGCGAARARLKSLPALVCILTSAERSRYWHQKRMLQSNM